jgi:hypothetical protein
MSRTASPSPLYSAERPGVRGFADASTTAAIPLTLTLSPEYRGEGTEPGSGDVLR